MLASGFVLLLTVILPHHHHEGGAPCLLLWNTEKTTDTQDTEEEHHHSCECNGHTIAFNSTTLQNHFHENQDLNLFLIPLHTLFDYVNSPLPFRGDRAFSSEGCIYIESQHSLWIPAAAGLRAPPSLRMA